MADRVVVVVVMLLHQLAVDQELQDKETLAVVVLLHLAEIAVLAAAVAVLEQLDQMEQI
jgi:hypothetical protein